MKWWDQVPWSLFYECWVLSQLFHSPLSPSSRGSWVAVCFLPLGWCHLHIRGYWYFSCTDTGTLLLYRCCYKKFSSVQFSLLVVSNSLPPHESQHARPLCPSPTPGVYSNSCPSSQWCHPAISSFVIPFSSCPQSVPASGSYSTLNGLNNAN